LVLLFVPASFVSQTRLQKLVGQALSAGQDSKNWSGKLCLLDKPSNIFFDEQMHTIRIMVTFKATKAKNSLNNQSSNNNTKKI
jgi:hypothetical protein